MAKRSPILGYNHNVRYRGLVFHVQTEDSGLLSPHLFTHLFHGGVIISTRKLVYDAGAAEDAIKSLMQAQHKAVLKELKKGTFDDKIDQYLAGTAGLLPRGVQDEEAGRESEPSLETPASGMPRLVPQPPIVAEARAKPEPATSRQPTEADLYELAAPGSPAAKVARTKTADRGSAPSAVRTNLPPAPPSSEELGGPTLNDHEAASIAAAISAANATIPTRMPTNDATVPTELPEELSPLEIELELDEPDELPRSGRDTDVAALDAPLRRMPGESVPPLPPPPSSHPRASSSVGAATLPPKPRQPSRPAITPPQVVSRPVAAPDRRNDDAVEVYAPAPPGAELPGERPGQYSQHKRVSQKLPVIETRKPPATGPVPIPAGLSRPAKISSAPSSGVPKPVTTTGSPGTQKSNPRESGANPIITSSAPRDQSAGTRTRSPTPSRVPIQPSRTASSASGGVVMTRPAVIVGAPAKPNQPPRVRKAREEEGRGFGQGLISEKSLDEVILAYLSEDADEK